MRWPRPENISSRPGRFENDGDCHRAAVHWPGGRIEDFWARWLWLRPISGPGKPWRLMCNTSLKKKLFKSAFPYLFLDVM